MDERRTNLLPIASAVLLLVLYVGSYLVVVRTKRQFIASSSGGVVVNFGDGKGIQTGEFEHYIACPALCRSIYWPIEIVDRRLRPEAWQR
jgi:hypothetical protein